MNIDSSFLIDAFTNTTVPVIDKAKSFEIPNALLNDIFKYKPLNSH